MNRSLSSNVNSVSLLHIQRGVGLIEILISLFVISIGILGLVGLQFTISTSNQDAYVKSQANFITESLADRIRINRQYQSRDDNSFPPIDASDNAYTTLNNYNFRNFGDCDSTEFECFCETVPASLRNCRDEGDVDAALCSPAEAAIFDAYEVSCMAAAVMDNVEVGAIALNAVPGANGDPVPPNTTLTVYTAWPATIWKNLDKAQNQVCSEILDAQGIEGDYECVHMDIVVGSRF